MAAETTTYKVNKDVDIADPNAFGKQVIIEASDVHIPPFGAPHEKILLEFEDGTAEVVSFAWRNYDNAGETVAFVYCGPTWTLTVLND